MKGTKRIRSQTDILAAFRRVYRGKGDGKRELANWCGVSHQCVCNWFSLDDGEPPGIPNGYHARLMLWAAHNGYLLHPGVFGLASDGTPARTTRVKAA